MGRADVRPPHGEPPVVCSTRDLRVSFGGVHALRGVDIAFRAGEVHALLGENGAGKSTLVKTLAGIQRPTSGALEWRGNPMEFSRPSDSQRVGIRVIHQELELAPALTVEENLFLGALPGTRGGILKRSELRRRAREALVRVGSSARPDQPLAELSIADRQLIEIARALAYDETQLLIMDEPTAALPPAEIDNLLELVRAISRRGVAVIYVSHRLDEVLRIADRATVLRDGTVISSRRREQLDHETLVRDIVGHLPESVDHSRASNDGAPVIEIRDFASGPVRLDAAVAKATEVVGFFGLLGAGQERIADGLYGIAPFSGVVTLDGARFRPSHPSEAARLGIGVVPAERKTEGLALSLTLSENLMLGAPDRGRLGWLSQRREKRRSEEILRRAGVAMRDADQAAGQLSGGNQQKIVLQRWMRRPGTKYLLLNEPTRGVDVGAKTEIHRSLRRWAADPDAGRSILLFSTDPEEVTALCDRVYVMSRGRIVGELAGAEISEAALTHMALSAAGAPAAPGSRNE